MCLDAPGVLAGTAVHQVRRRLGARSSAGRSTAIATSSIIAFRIVPNQGYTPPHFRRGLSDAKLLGVVAGAAQFWVFQVD